MKRLFEMVGEFLGAKKNHAFYMEQGAKAVAAGDYSDAERNYVNALEGAEESKDHDAVAAISLQLGSIAERLDKLAVAETYYKKAFQTEEDSEHFEQAAEALVISGRLYQRMRRLPDAEQVLQYAMAIYQQYFGPEHPGIASAANCLADCYLNRKSFAEAEKLLLRAIAIDEKQGSEKTAAVACEKHKLAISYQAQGKNNEAEQTFEQAASGFEKCRDSFNKSEAHNACACFHDYARYFLSKGNESQARPYLKKAMDLADQYPGYLDEADLADKVAAISA